MARLAAALLALLMTQDRADLALPVDTWYRVVQGSHPAGYVHETLKRAAAPWRIEYGYDAEFELTLRGKPHAEDLVVTAFLDDTLSPVEVASEGHWNDTRNALSLYVLGDQRHVDGGGVTWTQPARDEAFLLPSLALYLLRQNETLSRPGRITLRAIDPRGQEKAGVEVVLDAGAPVKRTYLGRETTVIPVAFVKPFPAARRETELQDAFVDRYGRILEARMTGGAKIVIAADRDEALAGIGLLHRHGRRDPFDKSLAMRNGALERERAARGEQELPAPRVTLDTLDSDLRAAQKLLEDVRAQKAAGDLEDARQTYLKTLVQLKAIRELAVQRRATLLPQIEQTRDDAEAAWDGAAQVEREAGRLFVQIRDLVDRLDVGGLERTQKELQALRDRIEVERRPEREQIAAWAAETGGVVVQCRTRVELARTRLDVTGITIGEQPTEELIDTRVFVLGQMLGSLQRIVVHRPFAMAEVNGRMVRAGDILEGTAIHVDKITARSVQFSLRDEQREVGLRQ